MTLGPVRVMGTGVVQKMCAEKVHDNYDLWCLIYVNIKTGYFSVVCSPLTNPNNGMINCSLGDDEVPSYEDTCSFTCNTGYELTGSDTRTCQSDGNWSGSDDVCRRGTCT